MLSIPLLIHLDKDENSHAKSQPTLTASQAVFASDRDLSDPPGKETRHLLWGRRAARLAGQNDGVLGQLGLRRQLCGRLDAEGMGAKCLGAGSASGEELP